MDEMRIRPQFVRVLPLVRRINTDQLKSLLGCRELSARASAEPPGGFFATWSSSAGAHNEVAGYIWAYGDLRIWLGM